MQFLWQHKDCEKGKKFKTREILLFGREGKRMDINWSLKSRNKFLINVLFQLKLCKDISKKRCNGI
jgi:hypothetical protein